MEKEWPGVDRTAPLPRGDKAGFRSTVVELKGSPPRLPRRVIPAPPVTPPLSGPCNAPPGWNCGILLEPGLLHALLPPLAQAPAALRAHSPVFCPWIRAECWVACRPSLGGTALWAACGASVGPGARPWASGSAGAYHVDWR